MNQHFHASLNFSSENESESDYDYSYENDDTPKNEVVPNISLKEKKNSTAPIHSSSPHRETRSNILRPIPKIKTSNGIPRPQTSESMINSQINSESSSLNEKYIIAHDAGFTEEQFYTIEMKRFKSFFGSAHKRFLMVQQNQLIYDLTIKSKDKLIKLPNKQHLEISKGRTEFSLKSDQQFQKELMKINFCPPLDGQNCKRRTILRFVNMKNISLPRKIVSITNPDDDNFNSHFHIPSVRNTVFVVEGFKTPVLSINELEKNRIEIRTILNIEKDIIFAIAITSFQGKDCSEKNSLIRGIKGFSLSPSLLINHENMVI